MKHAIIAVGLLSLLIIVGFAVGSRFAAAQTCGGSSCTASCNPPPDGAPLGPYRSSTCTYGTTCTCGGSGGTTPVPGWCRKETCTMCPRQKGTPVAFQCQTQNACELQERNLCLDACQP